MSLDTAAAIAKLRSLTVKFDQGAKRKAPFYPRVCTVVPSDGADEEYGFLGTMPAVREWLGDRVFKELSGAKFTLANRDWESSLRIEKKHIKDDRLGLYGPLLAQLGQRAMQHPDKLFFDLLQAGESSVCFDGQYFFDTDHAWGSSGSQSNDLTHNATDHTAVTAAEFRVAFHAARAKLLSFKDDQGEPLNQPTADGLSDLAVLVPPALDVVAHEAIDSVVLGNNTNIVLDRPQIVVSPFLTSSVKFWTMNLGEVLLPFVFQAREPLSRGMKGLDDLEFKDVKFMTEARYALGYLAWWTAVQTEFN
jgi:hypothetical protein